MNLPLSKSGVGMYQTRQDFQDSTSFYGKPDKAPMLSRSFVLRGERVVGPYGKDAYLEILSKIRSSSDSSKTLSPHIYLGFLQNERQKIDFDFKLIDHLCDERNTYCRELKTYLTQNPDSRFGINITHHAFLDPYFFEKFEKLLRVYSPYGKRILIELVEDFDFQLQYKNSPKNRSKFISQLDRLKRLGVGLVIDDYGVGGHKEDFLNFLPKNAPIQYVKIDGDYINVIYKKYCSRPDDFVDGMRRIRFLIQDHLPHTKIVCEKIDTHEEYKFRLLCDAGFEYFQGYMFPSVPHTSPKTPPHKPPNPPSSSSTGQTIKNVRIQTQNTLGTHSNQQQYSTSTKQHPTVTGILRRIFSCI